MIRNLRARLLTLACLLFYLMLYVDTASCSDLIKDEWLALLHYEKKYDGTYRSKIQDPKFFVTSNGTSNPTEEYRAIYNSLLIKPVYTIESDACKFPARAAFVAKTEKLPFDPLQCKDIRNFLNDTSPVGLTLVYVSPSMKSASTLFGHIFIRLESGKNKNLLDTAVSYAADTKNSTILSLVWKGLTGRFSGEFSTTPFYRKLVGYTNIEDRDLWEFPLQLSDVEVKQVALHAFELSRVTIPYYFLDDNCAGLIIDLIKSSGSSKFDELPSYFPSQLWVTPIDAVHNLNQINLISSYIYRPSLAKRLDVVEADMNFDEHAKVYKIFQNNVRYDQVKISSNNEVDLANILAEYKLAKLEITQEKFSEIMSQLPSPKNRELPESVSPLLSHRSRMFEVGYKYEYTDSFLSLKLKPTYHSLNDPVSGFPVGMSLDFLAFETLYNLTNSNFRLNRVDLLNINSYVPSKPFSSELSWKGYAGFNRDNIASKSRELNFESLIGLGLASNIRTEGIASGLLTIRGRSDFGSGDRFVVSPGLNLGFYNLKMGSFESGGTIQLDLDSKLRSISRLNITPDITYTISRDSAIGFLISINPINSDSTNISSMISYKVYF